MTLIMHQHLKFTHAHIAHTQMFVNTVCRHCARITLAVQQKLSINNKQKMKRNEIKPTGDAVTRPAINQMWDLQRQRQQRVVFIVFRNMQK